MDNPAQASDLTARGYSGTASPEVQQTWLDVAWRALRREVPTLDADLASGAVDPMDVIDVLASAVLRVLRNPEGFESESGQIDDYSESWKRSDASLDVFFTAAELRRLRTVSPFAGGWSGSVKYC